MNDFIKYKIENQFPFVLHQLKNLDKSFLEKRHLPHKWSVHEHLAHLGRYQEIFLGRLMVILKEETPLLERYKADNDQCFYEWCDLSTEQIISRANTGRQRIIQFLEELSKDQLRKVGIHPKLGRMDIEDWTSFFLLHEAHHIYAIFALKQQFK